MHTIETYSRDWCPYCKKAKALLRSKELDYHEIDITHDEVLEQEMIERSFRQTVPQIFVNGESIGGSGLGLVRRRRFRRIRARLHVLPGLHPGAAMRQGHLSHRHHHAQPEIAEGAGGR